MLILCFRTMPLDFPSTFSHTSRSRPIFRNDEDAEKQTQQTQVSPRFLFFSANDQSSLKAHIEKFSLMT